MFLVAVGLFVYVVYRAASLSFTHDESFTFTRHVHDSFSSILLYRELDANNHVLNTLAMKAAEWAFGPSELSLRLTSVLAFVVYVVAILILLRRVERWPFRLLGFSLAVANPYLLDFFSLARGYAVAAALVASSAAFALSYAARPRTFLAFGAVACAGLAVLASFATLVFYVGVPLVLVLALVVPRHIRGRRATGTWLAAAVVLPTIVVALLAARPLDRLKSAGELYVGGDNGFWQDTARSLVSSTLYRRGGEFLEIALVVVIAVLLVGGAVATVQAIGCRRLPAHAVAFVLLVTPAATSVALHHTSDSLFLIERTALFFVPLFAIWLALAADDLATRPRVSTGVTVAAVAVTVAAAVNLASAANFTHVLDWRYDASTKRMLGELDELPRRRAG